jgi:hypothetical protein
MPRRADANYPIQNRRHYSTRRWKMKMRTSAILIVALGPFCAGGAIGQSPGLSATDEPVNHADQASRREANRPPAPKPHSGNGNPLLAIPLESLRMTREPPLFSVSRPAVHAPLSPRWRQ